MENVTLFTAGQTQTGSGFRAGGILWVMVWKPAKRRNFVVLQFAVFAPDKIPLDSLGLFGNFTRHLLENHSDIMLKGLEIRQRSPQEFC